MFLIFIFMFIFIILFSCEEIPDLCCWWTNGIVVGVACGCCLCFVDFYLISHESASHICYEECVYYSRYICSPHSYFVSGLFIYHRDLFGIAMNASFKVDLFVWTFKIVIFHTPSWCFLLLWWMVSRVHLWPPSNPGSSFWGLTFLSQCIRCIRCLETWIFSHSMTLCYWIEGFAKHRIP